MSALHSFQKAVNDHINFAPNEIQKQVLIVESLLKAIEVGVKELKEVYIAAPAEFSHDADQALTTIDRHVYDAFKKYSGGV